MAIEKQKRLGKIPQNKIILKEIIEVYNFYEKLTDIHNKIKQKNKSNKNVKDNNKDG